MITLLGEEGFPFVDVFVERIFSDLSFGIIDTSKCRLALVWKYVKLFN